jgi:hypothetical protein
MAEATTSNSAAAHAWPTELGARFTAENSAAERRHGCDVPTCG